MTLQELRYLVAVADEGHFARAAEVCHVGQPTLSTQLKKLEDYLGVALFERNKRHLTPTPVGEEIIAEARVALEVMERIRELARQGHDAMDGPLRLGVIPSLGPYLIPHLLPLIHDAYPKLRLFLREDLTANLLEQLRCVKLDALLLALPVHSEGLDVMELFREPFHLALPAGHPLALQKQVHEHDLATQPLLLLEEGHCLRDQALEICASRERRDEVAATSLETLRQMVAAGVGCTLLPALATLPGMGAIQSRLIEIRPFAAPAPSRTIGVVWRHRYPRESTVRCLAELILAHLPACVMPSAGLQNVVPISSATASSACTPERLQKT
ncbi:MAG: LysR family transcriptional regulator [Burkholderiales bacterium]|nr:LysR family transcriptional regulator [Burkholderiales bacterium]